MSTPPPVVRALRPLVAAGIALQLGSSAPTWAADWDVRHDKNGIQVSVRAVEGSAYKEFKGTGVIPGPLDKVLDRILDTGAYASWFPDVSESRFLERQGTRQSHYVVTDFPWPVTDRDTVWVYDVTRSAAEAGIKVTVTPQALPEVDGLIRVSEVRGAWTFSAVDANTTRVTWQLHYEPAGRVPGWLANTAIVDIPRDMLIALRSHFGG